MMKKRNVAMAMAAVTAASSVAPVFAAGTVKAVEKEIFSKTEKSSLVSELSRLSKIVYASTDANEDLRGKSAYDVLIKLGETTTDGNLVDFVNANAGIGEYGYDMNAFKAQIDNLTEDMKVYIIEKGHTTVDGKVLSTQNGKYESYSELVTLKNEINAADPITVGDVDVTLTAEIVNGQVKVTLTADDKTPKTFYIKQGENKVNIEAFTYTKEDETFETIKRFADATPEDIESKYENKDEVLSDLSDGVAAVYTIKAAQTEKETVANLYDGYRLTAKGNEVKNGLVADSINVETNSTTKVSTMILKYNDEKGNLRELKVESKSRTELDKLVEALEGNATIKTISGNTRYTTAIEIAKKNETTNIVLVNSNAIVDGLAATPLAKATDSSILLTDKDAIQADTLAYIKGLVEDENVTNPHIYIVGGEGAVSASVESKLKSLVGSANVDRFGGENRHETSLSVAEFLKDEYGVSNAFVVGANGEADAMSIAGYAASINAPIIVNGFSGMSADSLEYLTDLDVDIIGGSTAVSSEVEEQLKSVDYNGEVVRTEGKTRFETNAKVIEAYFGSNIENVYIAKDGVAKKDQLVDALAAGPLMAGTTTPAPVVLATDSLSEVQEEALLDNVKYGAEVTQIGGGVGLSVVKKIVDLLGL